MSTAAAAGTDAAMPHGNVEIVKAYFEAFDRGELDAAAAYLDPGVHWHNEGLIDDETVTGRAAVRAYWERILTTFPFVHDDPVFEAAGDRVCVTATLRTRGAASGVELTRPCGYALELRGGLVTRSEFFGEPADARRAAGFGDV